MENLTPLELESAELREKRHLIAVLFYDTYINGAESPEAVKAIAELISYDGDLEVIQNQMALNDYPMSEAETLRAIREETDEEEPTLAEIVGRGFDSEEAITEDDQAYFRRVHGE